MTITMSLLINYTSVLAFYFSLACGLFLGLKAIKLI